MLRRLIIGGVLLAGLVSATHFRFGTIQSKQTPNPSFGTGRDVTFTITSAWRKTFFGGGNFNVGATVQEQSTFFFPDATRTNGGGTVFNMLVNVVNNVSDWFIATQTIYSTYYTNGNYIATFSSCCRISTLINNPNGNFRVTAMVPIVDGASFTSIQSQVVPIVNAGQNQQLNFRVGVVTYQNEFLGYRLATAVEAAGAGKPYAQIQGLTLDFNTGLISWTPTTQGFYSLQVVVQGYTAQPDINNQQANLQSYVAVDFLIDVVPPTQKQCKRFCSNLGALCFSDADCFSCIENGAPSLRTPYCVLNTPPFFTAMSFNGAALNLAGANNGSALTLDVQASFGSPVTLNVVAADNNVEDFVTIVSSVIPAGAVASLTPNANPATLSIKWTPTAAQVGTVICFTATDSLMHSNNGLLCVRINLLAGNLAASGRGLTYAVAGQFTSVNIQDSPSRTVTMTITGFGNTINAQVTPLAGSSNGVTSNYTGSYNVPTVTSTAVTKAGFYSLVIADTTTGLGSAFAPAPLSFTLQVVPAQTDPTQTQIFQQGSSGLSGGVSGSTLSFLLQARDAFDNNQIGALNDVFTMTTTFGTTVTPYNFLHIGNGVWNVSYKVPTSTSAATYTLSVYYANTTASNILVATYTANILTNSFFITTIPVATNGLTFTAGASINFIIVVPVQSDGSQGSKTFSVTINTVAATVNLINATSGQPAYYQVTASPVTLASTYISGILITAAGLNGNNPGVVNYDLIIVPSTASGPNSVLAGNFVDLIAGTPVTLAVNLKDVYGNAVVNGQDVVAFSYSVVGTNQPVSGNAVFDGISAYTFSVSVTAAGTLTLSLSISPSAVNTGGTIAQSPYTLKVVPDTFSFTQSGASGVFSTIAGIPQLLTLTSLDRFRNERNVDPDAFQANFSLSLGNNNFVYGGTSIVQLPSTGRYSISYQTNVTGSWNLNLAVLKIEDQAQGLQTYVSFTNIPITVNAGPIVPSNAKIFGSGAAGGTEGGNALLMMQSRDSFSNVVPVPGGGLYLIQVTSPAGVVSYYSARYCSPGATTCPLNSTIDAILTQTTAAAMDTTDQFATLSPEEQLQSAAGFWKINYPVPLRSATAGSNFSIAVFYGNMSEFQTGDTAAAIIARNSTIKVFGPVQATSSPAATGGGGGMDNWGVIALGVGSGAVFLSAVGYGAWRMQRYRPKYKEQKQRADQAEQMLQEMADEVDVIPGGRDWDAVGAATVTLNPLHPASTLKTDELKRLEQIHDPQAAMQDTRGVVRKEFAPRPIAKTQTGTFGNGDSLSFRSEVPARPSARPSVKP